MTTTNDTKHQRAIGVVLDQFAQRGIYLAVRTEGRSYRLQTTGRRNSIRVAGLFTGDWQMDDWRKAVADDTYNTVVLVDFTQPAPLLFIIPGDTWRKELEEHAIPGRDSGHQAVARERVLPWLYRWDVLDGPRT